MNKNRLLYAYKLNKYKFLSRLITEGISKIQLFHNHQLCHGITQLYHVALIFSENILLPAQITDSYYVRFCLTFQVVS